MYFMKKMFLSTIFIFLKPNLKFSLHGNFFLGNLGGFSIFFNSSRPMAALKQKKFRHIVSKTLVTHLASSILLKLT